ncbi:MAG: M20/M25/M40 family metallo-hydrolase, partial [Candidatus Margulisiibacteriota bacterium]
LGADDKAGVAVTMELLSILIKGDNDHCRLLCGDLLIVLTVREETGLHGARAMDKRMLKADFGFALDGGSVDVILNAAPTQVNLQAEIVGRAAHAGTHPEDGINAIKVASEAIAGMKLGRIDHETTANIGIIKGGIATNIVPEKVKIKGEARSHDRKKLKNQIVHMQTMLKKACAKNRAKLYIEIKEAYSSFRISKNDKVLQLVSASLKKLKLRPEVKPSGGGSDANIFNARGIKTLILGVGGHNLHSPKEHLNIKEMELALKLLMEVITENARRND